MDVEKAKRAVIRSFNFTPNFIATSEDRDCIIKLLGERDEYKEWWEYAQPIDINIHREELKHYKKYKKIVEEVERFLAPGVITEIPEDMVGSRHIDIITYQIKKIKQKYFPETFKKTVTVEIEAKDTDGLAFGLKTIGNVISDISGDSGIAKMKIIDIGRMKKGEGQC